MNDCCSSMNIAHCLNPSAYQKNVERLQNASRKTFDEVATKSVETIFKEYAELGIVPDKDGTLDIGVSFDGSWQRRATLPIMV